MENYIKILAKEMYTSLNKSKIVTKNGQKNQMKNGLIFKTQNKISKRRVLFETIIENFAFV